ncbi:MAG: ParB/RepB/Spo0J family partition protein [Clostridium sp.]|jgi:ParB family chromosome partitioning protein|nr:ParB/RepB/Spo0J family partition protein [Clostridium sp.]
MVKKSSASRIISIPHKSIIPSPFQARTSFPAEEMELLAQSIRQNGVMQPLTVRRISAGRYELIAGERRLRAARMAGLEALPCVVRAADDTQAAELCLLENLQRSTLSFNEEAEALRRLRLQTGLPPAEIAQKIGITEQEAAQSLELLKLPRALREQLSLCGFGRAHALELLRLPSPPLRQRCCELICKKKLSAQDTARLVERLLAPPRRPPIIIFKDVKIFVNTIENAVETMRTAGIRAQYAKREDEDCAEFLIKIPKRPGG